MMYEVEPNDYTYGFDRNNNDEREGVGRARRENW